LCYVGSGGSSAGVRRGRRVGRRDPGLERCVTLCALAGTSRLSQPSDRSSRSGSATAEHADFRGGHDGRNAPQPEPTVRMHSWVDQRRMRRRLI